MRLTLRHILYLGQTNKAIADGSVSYNEKCTMRLMKLYAVYATSGMTSYLILCLKIVKKYNEHAFDFNACQNHTPFGLVHLTIINDVHA